MKRTLRWILILLAVAGLVACGGEATVKPEVEDLGAETGGAAGPGDVSGQPLDGARADLLGERRVYFAFDSSAVDEESRAIIEAHAAYLTKNPGFSVTLEGHCDERGTREYNLALGERRAMAVARLFRAMGVNSSRIVTLSYGEEKPVSMEHTEAAWRQNRRVEILY